MKGFLISISLLALMSGNAFAEIYKWKDASGKIGYGNVPPDGAVQYIEFASKPKTTPGNLTKKESNSLEPTDEREKKIAEDLAKETLKASQNCAKSRESLQLLESGVRVVRYNAKGDKEILDDKARNAEMINAKRAISEWCVAE